MHTPATGAPVSSAVRARDAERNDERDAEISALQDRISKLEALVERDEDVLRQVLSLLVDKDIATREEILERMRG